MKFKNFIYYIFRIIRLSLIILSIFVFVSFFIVRPGKVDGYSMEPTYKNKEIFLVNKLIYLFTPPKRYDCIQIIKPQSKELLIKRIIGLPNDTIKIENGYIFRLDEKKNWQKIRNVFNNQKLTRTYPANRKEKTKIYEVDENSFFVLGDNRFYSTDSRHFGFVKREEIVGKIIPITHTNK